MSLEFYVKIKIPAYLYCIFVTAGTVKYLSRAELSDTVESILSHTHFRG